MQIKIGIKAFILIPEIDITNKENSQMLMKSSMTWNWKHPRDLGISVNQEELELTSLKLHQV